MDAGLVQPIVVGRDGSHEDTIVAAATAAVDVWWATADDPAWRLWLGSAFTKSVRHTNLRELAKVAALCPIEATVVGGAVAYGMLPVSYEAMDRRVRRCQVAGLDLERADRPVDVSGPGLLVSVNAGLGMSTGKAAAQVAHALFLHALTADRLPVAVWAASGFPFTLDAAGVHFDRPAPTVEVRDAGFTEIAPGSITVRAWPV